MTPWRAIAMLDRQIRAHGQPVTLRRMVTNGDPVDLQVGAFVRGYKPEELVGGIAQGDTMVTLSPTSLAGSALEASPPRRNDKVLVDGRLRNVEMADPVRLAGTLVRLNLQVRG